MNTEKLISDKDDKIKLLNEELESIKLVAAYMETQREEELQFLKKRHEEEISSLQHIVREANNHPNIGSSGSLRYPQPPETLPNFNQLKINNVAKLSPDKDGVFTRVRSVWQKKSPMEEGDDLEASVLKAKEHSDMLRCIVAPYEEEISDLNRQLKFYKLQFERKKMMSDTKMLDSSDSEREDDQLIDLNSPNLDTNDAFISTLVATDISISTDTSIATDSKPLVCDSCERLATRCESLETELCRMSRQVVRLEEQNVQRDRRVEEDFRKEVEKSNKQIEEIKRNLTTITELLNQAHQQLNIFSKLPHPPPNPSQPDPLIEICSPIAPSIII